MSNAAMAMGGEAAVTPTALSWKFIRWGLGAVHHRIPDRLHPDRALHGWWLRRRRGSRLSENHYALWGCPAILAELTLKTGGLGMIAIGFCYQAIIRQGASPNISSHERIAPVLCAFGLIATLVSAAAGYVICNYFWPKFYFDATPAGKNVWLAAQGLSIAVYVVGVCYSFAGIRRASAQFR